MKFSCMGTYIIFSDVEPSKTQIINMIKVLPISSSKADKSFNFIIFESNNVTQS